MNEYIFRGKHVDNGEWIEGCLILDYTKTIYYVTRLGECCGEVIPETVGMWTGLTDKNGKRIFEGDIVKGDNEYFAITHPNGLVVYDEGQYLIAFDNQLEDIEVLGAWAKKITIVGNIHDNPELLEGEA